MEIAEKLKILSDAAKYDASCASSGSGTPKTSGRSSGKKSSFGMAVPAGVCHSWTQDGRCVSLLKVLYSNVCRYDCAYCVNRASSDIKRASFTEDEIVNLTAEFYRRNYIEGLFLSCGIFSDPDIVMEKLINVSKKLRNEIGFGGYIHLKIIPGTGEKMLKEAGLWADRLSVNIELPSDESLKKLAPDKSGKEILGSMENFKSLSLEAEESKRKTMFYSGGKNTQMDFAQAGQSTQLIVGASLEDDLKIINLTSALYRKFSMRRVYYSAFIPQLDPRLPIIKNAPLVREHRLYQADWLLRFYHFNAKEILTAEEPFLDPLLDPKTAWALRNPDFFPIEVNKACYETLLRVPGIGAKTARRVVESRRSAKVSFEKLASLGAVLKRARYFCSCQGTLLEKNNEPERIRRLLSGQDGAGLQLPLFEF